MAIGLGLGSNKSLCMHEDPRCLFCLNEEGFMRDPRRLFSSSFVISLEKKFILCYSSECVSSLV